MFSSRAIARAGLRASSNVQISRSAALGSMRTYAAAAAAQDSRPPVALYGVDGTYANALVSGFIQLGEGKSSVLKDTGWKTGN